MALNLQVVQRRARATTATNQAPAIGTEAYPTANVSTTMTTYVSAFNSATIDSPRNTKSSCL